MTQHLDLLEQQRENWGSRAGFVLAAVGSAVGLGNLWGFPYKLYSYGGGAFLIPYVLAMLMIGIPLMILEFSLGHMTQRAAPDAYRGINRRTEPVGWWGILLGFVIITYYPVILAYCGDFLYQCVRSIATREPLPWAGEGLAGVANAKDYFFNRYLQMWPDGSWKFGNLVTPIVVSLVVIWALMYLCIFRGVKLVSKVVLWTVPLPWIMLLILTFRGLTLEGAAQGLNFYLDPDFSRLGEPETWRWAFGQMFFSMSLAFGVMITYASFLHRKSDINNNAAIIGLADIGTSFMAGLAIFATLGAMAFATQAAAVAQADPELAVPVEEVVGGGPGLAFVAFPYALAQLPGAAWFGAVFFIALLLLGVDSAFSITESVLASLVDKTGWSRGRTLIGMSLVGLLLGLVYCTRGGLIWLDHMDSFINSTWGGIALLGLLEFVVVGWGYRLGRLRSHANERSDWYLGKWWEVLVRYIAPVLLAVLFSWSLLDRITAPGGFLFASDGTLIVPVLAALIVAVLAPLLSLILSWIRSPGADAHAAHVGQPRIGRGVGVVGTVVVFAMLIAIAVGGVFAYRGGKSGGRYVAAVQQTGGELKKLKDAEAPDTEKIAAKSHALRSMIGGPEAGPAVARGTVRENAAGTASGAVLPALAAVAFGIIATILGASMVARAERVQNRPSGFARWSAGWGVIGIGIAGGILLYVNILPHSMDKGVAKAAALLWPAKPAEAPARELTSSGYVVLAVFFVILVVGLGWCFYRAMKASAQSEQQQLAEGIDEA